MAVDTSGAYVLTASDDGFTRIYDSGGSGPPIETLAGDTGPVRSASFGGYGEYVATSSADGTARVWQGPRPIPAVSRPDRPTGDPSTSSIGYEPGGQRIVLTGGVTPSGTGQIIQSGTLRTTATFRAPAGQVFVGSAIGRDGTIVALADRISGTNGIPASVDTYNGQTGALLAQMVPGDGRTLRGAGLNPSGSIVVLICAGGVVELPQRPQRDSCCTCCAATAGSSRASGSRTMAGCWRSRTIRPWSRATRSRRSGTSPAVG